MIQKNPFLKYLIKDKKEDFFHTSRHARVQNGANMGAASTETFAQRRQIDQNRTRVKKYSDSRIAAQAMAGKERPKVYTPPEKNAGGIGVGQNGSSSSAAGGKTVGGAGSTVGGGRTAGGSLNGGGSTSSLRGGTPSRPNAPRPPMPRR